MKLSLRELKSICSEELRDVLKKRQAATHDISEPLPLEVEEEQQKRRSFSKEQIEAFCNNNAHYDVEHLLKLINAISLSSKGGLNKSKK